MPRPFAQSTAELVMQVTEAVQANGKADSMFVESFCDLSPIQANNALQLAADLGLQVTLIDLEKNPGGGRSTSYRLTGEDEELD